jgi:hypothetical protein
MSGAPRPAAPPKAASGPLALRSAEPGSSAFAPPPRRDSGTAAQPPAASGDLALVVPQPGTVALSLWTTQLEVAFLAAEAGSVLTLRMMSFSGLRPMVPGEHLRMVAEKPPAFLAAALAAWIATVSGQRADQVLAAGIRPLRAEASANVLRLSR